MEQTNKEQAMVELEQLKKEFDERTKKLEEIINQEEKESVVWKPKEGEVFYFIEEDGVIRKEPWRCDEWWDSVYALGNCYKTRQEAEDARDARIILTRLQRLADEMNGGKLRYDDWCGKNPYILGCSPSVGAPFTAIDTHWTGLNSNACFLSKPKAESALTTIIKEFGEDKVKMALSGVWR